MKILVIFFTFIFFQAAQAHEDLPPLFELGFFVGSISISDYPASDQQRIRTIPAPLISYRGGYFRSDQEAGTRYRFLKSDQYDFDLSFGGSFPTDTNNNQARLNMPNLDWTGEIGPRFLYYIYRDRNFGYVRLALPYRFTFATNFTKWYTVGTNFEPTFEIDKVNFLFEHLTLSFSHHLNYFDQGQADYFFQVDSNYQTSQRAYYDAKAGLLGSSTSLNLKYQWNDKTFIIGSNYADYSNSVNTQSDLHKNNINWSHFIGFGWILSKSLERGVR
jgi:outer membrane protein